MTENYVFSQLLIERTTILTHKNILLFTMSVTALEPIKIIRMNLIDTPDGYITLHYLSDTCKIYTAPQYKLQSIIRLFDESFTTKKLKGDCKPFRNENIRNIWHMDWGTVCDDDQGLIEYRKDMAERANWAQGCYEGVIYNPETQENLVFGFVSFGDYLCYNDLTAQNNPFPSLSFQVWHPAEKLQLNTNQSKSSAVFMLRHSFEPINDSRIEYAQLVSKFCDVQQISQACSGYCSWHRLFQNMDEATFLNVVDFIADHPQYFPNCENGFRYIQLDYCWQKYCGRMDLENHLFPHGLKYVNDYIHSKGFLSGIWIAPTTLEISKEDVNSPLFELVIKDKNGMPKIITENWFSKPNKTYGLDITNPKAVQFMLDQIQTIIVEFGFDMIKMDFLENALVTFGDDCENYVFYNKQKSSLAHLIDFLKQITQLVKQLEKKLNKKIWISPCGSPTYHLAGIFGSSYIAEDAGYQRLHENMGVMAFAQTWAVKQNLHQALFCNNLESVLLDQPRPYHEARILLTAAFFSRGIIFIGDLLPNLSHRQLSDFSKILPLCRYPTKVIDAFQHALPQTYLAEPNTQAAIVAELNWEKHPVCRKLSFSKLGLCKSKKYHVFDFWAGQYLGSYITDCEITLPAVSDGIYAIKRDQQIPCVISTDTHILQGYDEIFSEQFEKGELSFCFQPYKAGDAIIFLHIPKNYKLVTLFIDGNEFSKYLMQEQIVKIYITCDTGQCVSVKGEFA